MNRVVALICTAGLLGAAYYARPLWAQDKDAKENEFKANPSKTRVSDDRLILPKDRPVANPGAGGGPFGRLIDDDDDQPKANREARPAGRMGLGGRAFAPGMPDADVMFRRRVITRPVQEEIMEPVPPEEQEEHKQFRTAMRQLTEIKDDDPNKKDEISKTLRELLNKQFERDLAHREKELAVVEERVRTLRKQLDKRKSAKDEIITLRIKTIVNNVEGLGFPGEEGVKDGPAFHDFSPRVYRDDDVNYSETIEKRPMPGTPGIPARRERR